ncbi:hypothetical protein B5X24_HaOG214778 [Helicoverpa armigera]|nr:hypothetical protein B5X24_HaOG214778 [Helicoverpa armigera]
MRREEDVKAPVTPHPAHPACALKNLTRSHADTPSRDRNFRNKTRAFLSSNSPDASCCFNGGSMMTDCVGAAARLLLSGSWARVETTLALGCGRFYLSYIGKFLYYNVFILVTIPILIIISF